MAVSITIEQQPFDYSPAYNPIWWVVSSTNTAQSNFEYICDIYITGVTFAGGQSYLRMKCPADPVYGRGIFNVSNILQSQLSGNLGDTIYGFQQCQNSVLEYSVKFGELYGASSGIIAYPNITIVTGETSFNGSLGNIEWKDYQPKNYVAELYTTKINLLTNAPSSGTIRIDENQWIYAMSQTSGAIKFANVNVYTNGVLSVTGRFINYQYHNTSTIANRMIRFPSGYNINDILVDPVLILPTHTSWEIYFTDTDHNRITDSYFVFADATCTAHTVYRIHFKNKLGGYDSFSFIRASQITTDIKRDKFQKVLGEFKSAASYTYNKSDRSETNFNTEYKETIKLNSDWITEDQSVWIQELFSSPDIKMEDDSGNLIPINIIDTQYTQRKHNTDKIFNIEVSIQTTFTETRQRA